LGKRALVAPVYLAFLHDTILINLACELLKRCQEYPGMSCRCIVNLSKTAVNRMAGGPLGFCFNRGLLEEYQEAEEQGIPPNPTYKM